MKTLSVYDKVIFNGEEFVVSRKRTGVDMYEICKVVEWYGAPYDSSPKVVTDIRDGIRAEELERVEEKQCDCRLCVDARMFDTFFTNKIVAQDGSC